MGAFSGRKKKQSSGFPQASFLPFNTFLSSCLIIHIFPKSHESSLRELKAALGVLSF